MDEEDYVSLRGPVEMVDGSLALQIPLDAGGWELHSVGKAISEIVGNNLIVQIPAWLAGELGIAEGSFLFVDNRHGKFNMTVDTGMLQ